MTAIPVGHTHEHAGRGFVQDLLFAAGMLSSIGYAAANLVCGLRYASARR
jgi:hypothetical protein